MAPKPTSQTLTLRLKHHKTTIFLHVDRTQTFTSIASDLLDALKQRYPDNTLGGHTIPSDPAAVRFARCVDDAEPGAGWAAVLTGDGEGGGDDEGKGAKRKASLGRKKSVLEADCPMALGLKNASLLAFRFVELDAAGGGDGEDVDELRDGKGTWDVVLPSFDDDEGGVADEEEIEVPEIDVLVL